MGDFIQNTILPAFMKFVNTRGVRAIKDGMMFTMPLIIVGAVYLLLFQLPIEAAADFVSSLGDGAVVSYLSHGYTSTFQIIAMVCAVGVGYTWAKNDGWEPLSAGVIALALFLILIPDYIGATVNASGSVAVQDTATAAEGAQNADFATVGEYASSGISNELGEAASKAASDAFTQITTEDEEKRAIEASEFVTEAVTTAAKSMKAPAGNQELFDSAAQQAAEAAAKVVSDAMGPGGSNDAAQAAEDAAAAAAAAWS